MSKNLFIGLLLAALMAVGLYWDHSGSSSVEEGTQSGASQPQSSSPGNSQTFRSIPTFPRGPNGSRSGNFGFSSTPGWEDRDAKKRGAPPIEDEKEDDLYQLIEEALHASDPDDRAYAVEELGDWDPTPEVLTVCLAALNDPEEEVREEAVLALETLEDPSAIPALERVAREDPSEDVRDAAVEALEYLMD